MKKTAILILMLLSAALISCNKSDDNNPSPSDIQTYKETVPGKWKVSYYYENGKDETSNYSSYSFDFGSSGALTASSGSQTFQGSWSTTIDDSLPRLVITISGNDDLVELSDDWVIKSMSGSEISLEDDNTTKTEVLKFSKIN